MGSVMQCFGRASSYWTEKRASPCDAEPDTRLTLILSKVVRHQHMHAYSCARRGRDIGSGFCGVPWRPWRSFVAAARCCCVLYTVVTVHCVYLRLGQPPACRMLRTEGLGFRRGREEALWRCGVPSDGRRCMGCMEWCGRGRDGYVTWVGQGGCL
ncbi:hypothetical protein BDW74DRAFT_148477 [Aspergillus multicolor]|uniref:uncharacterized protein n=1 Tax=Aspergillus multicolor TaxID=41759 RepID=UPI003CCDFF88